MPIRLRYRQISNFQRLIFSDADVLFLPGGMPGTRNLAAHRGLCDELLKADRAGKRLATICAGPSVLGDWESWKGERPRVIRALKGN